MQMKLRMLRNFLKTTKLGKADQDKSLVCLTKILSSSWEPGSQDNHWKQVLQQTRTAAMSSFALGWLAQAFPLLLRELASTAIKLVLGTGLWQNKLLSIRTYLWSYAFFPRGNQQPWRTNSGVPIFTPCLQMGLPRGVTIPRAPCAVRRRLHSKWTHVFAGLLSPPCLAFPYRFPLRACPHKTVAQATSSQEMLKRTQSQARMGSIFTLPGVISWFQNLLTGSPWENYVTVVSFSLHIWHTKITVRLLGWMTVYTVEVNEKNVSPCLGNSKHLINVYLIYHYDYQHPQSMLVLWRYNFLSPTEQGCKL